MGVLSATTAFGKTVVGAYLIGERKVSTLILVHSSALLEQWKTSLEQFLSIREPLPEQPKRRGRKSMPHGLQRNCAGKQIMFDCFDLTVLGLAMDANMNAPCV